MSHKRLWISAGIIAFVILTTFILLVPHTRDIEVTSLPAVATVKVPSITLHDAFKKGLHTISGSIEALNACTPVSASANIISNVSSTQSILVAISVKSDSGVCLQIPTRISFQTTVSAPANLPIIVTVNGSSATTTPQ